MKAKTKTKPKSFTQITEKFFTSVGYSIDKTESYNFFSKRKKDLFNCIDFVAVKNTPVYPIIGVQITSRDNVSSRVNKIINVLDGLDDGGEPIPNPIHANAAAWVGSGAALWIIGWDSHKDIKGRLIEIVLNGNGSLSTKETTPAAMYDDITKFNKRKLK